MNYKDSFISELEKISASIHPGHVAAGAAAGAGLLGLEYLIANKMIENMKNNPQDPINSAFKSMIIPTAIAGALAGAAYGPVKDYVKGNITETATEGLKKQISKMF